MAYGAIQKISTDFESYPGYWLKGFEQGTTTPLAMATSAAATTLLAKAEISSGGVVPIGFIKTAGNAIFQPYFDEPYDAWLFPTEAEADANDTSNAIQVADNASPFPSQDAVTDYTGLDALLSTDYSDNTVIQVTDNGIAGVFVSRTGAHTPNVGTIRTFGDDSGRYWSRVFLGGVDARWFLADNDLSSDSSVQIQLALDNFNEVILSDGSYRADQMIEVGPGKSLTILRGAILKRTTDTTNTDPVLFAKGIASKLLGSGEVRTDNDHPEGVILMGHRDSTSGTTYNAQKWVLGPLDVYGKLAGSTGVSNTTVGTTPGVSANIGVFITSSQPTVGSSVSNYFGSISGTRINQADVGMCFTDQANAHQVVDIFMQDIFGAYVMTHGAYGNNITGVWCHRGLDTSVIALYLRDKLQPSAPFVASHDSLRNIVHGLQNESGSTTGATVNIEVGSRDNWILFQHNVASSSISDAGGENWYFESRGALSVETLNVQDGGDVTLTDLTISKASSPNLKLLDSDVSIYSEISGDNNGTLNFSSAIGGGTGIIRAFIDSVEAIRISNPGRHFSPGADDIQTCGTASLRWSEIFAGTGTINTSDEREKTDWNILSRAERRAALAIKEEIKRFRWIDSMSKKGDIARHHFGVGAQTVGKIMSDNGLDPSMYAFFCYDEWTDEFLEKKGTSEKITTSGNRYGIRYDELLCFIISAM